MTNKGLEFVFRIVFFYTIYVLPMKKKWDGPLACISLAFLFCVFVFADLLLFSASTQMKAKVASFSVQLCRRE